MFLELLPHVDFNMKHRFLWYDTVMVIGIDHSCESTVYARKPVYGGLRTTKGADQPAHPHSLISAFVIRFLENFICKLATGEISIF